MSDTEHRPRLRVVRDGEKAQRSEADRQIAFYRAQLVDLSQENEALRAEVARLRRLVRRP